MSFKRKLIGLHALAHELLAGCLQVYYDDTPIVLLLQGVRLIGFTHT